MARALSTRAGKWWVRARARFVRRSWSLGIDVDERWRGFGRDEAWASTAVKSRQRRQLDRAVAGVEKRRLLWSLRFELSAWEYPRTLALVVSLGISAASLLVGFPFFSLVMYIPGFEGDGRMISMNRLILARTDSGTRCLSETG